MDAWDIFCLTGHIDDYLQYRRCSTTELLAQPDKELDLRGDIPWIDSGTTIRRRQGEIH